MARGWESKSVESQKEEQRDARPRRDDVAQQELELTRKRESLESSRRGIARELQATRSELRRRSLEAALAHLYTELGKLR